MKLIGDLRKVWHTALLALACVILFNNQEVLILKDSHNTKVVSGHFISASNHMSGLFADEDYSNPADNEEDEDEDDDEDGAESSVSRSYQEFTISISYKFYQDQLFCDPHGELISPPPKS